MIRPARLISSHDKLRVYANAAKMDLYVLSGARSKNLLVFTSRAYSNLTLYSGTKCSVAFGVGELLDMSFYYPCIFLPREDAIHQGGIQGLLTVQRRAKRESIRCVRMACSHVLPRPEQG